jgi:bacillithiol system protein YtxJ
MEWQIIQTEAEIQPLIEMSDRHPVLFFKHSTRCSISNTAKNRLEKLWPQLSPHGVLAVYIDVLTNRPSSFLLSSLSSIEHESPQAILFHKGQCIYHQSHLGIDVEEMLKAIENN